MGEQFTAVRRVGTRAGGAGVGGGAVAAVGVDRLGGGRGPGKSVQSPRAEECSRSDNHGRYRYPDCPVLRPVAHLSLLSSKAILPVAISLLVLPGGRRAGRRGRAPPRRGPSWPFAVGTFS